MLRPLAFAACLAAAPVLTAQQIDSTPLTPTRIYGTAEFAPQPFGPTQWLADGAAYTTVEPSGDGTGLDIVRYDVETGARAVLVPAAALLPEGATEPIEIEDYSWSPDGRMLLVFTKTQPVWRLNTRGDYWVLDRTSGRLRQLGGKDAKPSTLLFAKFSPDGGRVGYVRENNLYVEDLATGAITPLTSDGSRTLINGTFDWVYEEELMNYYADGWRWSPDGRSVAYWQLNADQVKDFNLINNTASLYSRVIPVQYPKAGEANSAARVGVVRAAGGPTTWLQLEGDPREHYIARMEWAAGSTEVALQRLNRLQNVAQIILGDARTGATRVILTERDSTWVDVVNDMVWLEGGKNFTWVSERSGWRHVYLVSRDGRTMRPVTQGAFDVIEVQGIDAKGGWLYYIASPENPAQRYLFRTRLDGKGKPERLTPRTESGTHAYNRSPSFRHAIESWSYFGTPPVVRLVRLPGHQVVRTLNDNARLRAGVAAIPAAPVEFTTLPADDGTPMPTWVMKPVNFDSTRKYPVLLYLYGGPGNITVSDAWIQYHLWHLMLTHKGYIVVSVDNRGTPAPLGHRWRKTIYGEMGVPETKDQASAMRAFLRRPYTDPARVGIWGWSYGGFMALNELFQHPDIFGTAIAVSPVTHWSLYDNIYTERYNGLPSANRDGYDRGSPISYVNGLRGNLLLVHGSGDDNVHYQNSELLINALVAANKPFTLMEYPNRTHCICQGKNTQAHLFELMTRYLDDHLLGPASRAAPDRAAGAH